MGHGEQTAGDPVCSGWRQKYCRWMSWRGMKGILIITESQERYPEIKIITMSGGGKINAATYLQLARGLRAASTLNKPFAGEELLKALSEVLAEPWGIQERPTTLFAFSRLQQEDALSAGSLPVIGSDLKYPFPP